MISVGKTDKEISESLCLSLKVVYIWTKKLSLQTATQNKTIRAYIFLYIKVNKDLLLNSSNEAWKNLRIKNYASIINQTKNFAIRYCKKDRENLIYLDKNWFKMHTSKSYRYSHVNTLKNYCAES
ncbi:hypothetical protein MXB_4712 [Myxobolus squamalis]|nr:hypothetical protein MXB_4712 [Myxobolus squamalis]